MEPTLRDTVLQGVAGAATDGELRDVLIRMSKALKAKPIGMGVARSGQRMTRQQHREFEALKRIVYIGSDLDLSYSSEEEAVTAPVKPLSLRASSSGESAEPTVTVAAASPPGREAARRGSPGSAGAGAASKGARFPGPGTDRVGATSDLGGRSGASRPSPVTGQTTDTLPAADFQPVLNRQAEKKRRANGRRAAPAAPTTAAPGAHRQPSGEPRQKPLVVEGLSEVEKANPLALKSLLKSSGLSVLKTVVTKRGTVLAFPQNNTDKNVLLSLQIRQGVLFRETRAGAAAGNRKAFVVVCGVHPSVTDEEMREETQRPCCRIRSSRLGGEATWKVKIECGGEDDKAKLVKEGIVLGHQRYKVVAFINRDAVLQCYKCLGFNHLAAACKEELKCRRCGGKHEAKECKADEPACANCEGKHQASDFACPAYAREQTRHASTTLSYAAAVKKGGDQVDCLRLATCMATAIATVLTSRVQIPVVDRVNFLSNVCKDVADTIASVYRTDVRGEYVFKLAHGVNVGKKPQP